MDRRQRKTREAIFRALTELLAERRVNQITVGQIIARADVGRATFYAHFETKEQLLQAFCQELFCHIFDSVEESHDHRHIFDCTPPQSVFLHLFQHLRKNDNRILALLTCENNDLFWGYFREGVRRLAERQQDSLPPKPDALPQELWIAHIAATFLQTLQWWLGRGMPESPQRVTEYFLLLLC